ncbi:MAG: VCBS repeat-containing protein [Kofleriaceae bacterium]|nr:VCBS repeat-containing protein [Myxococcales bacterium]MCB9562494.1 VCBS repeat-containing protein [Kofleriaceae bacterium]MCB9570747.1 VCBS repeat-containing protein [Kofleriaceae bacterium]
MRPPHLLPPRPPRRVLTPAAGIPPLIAIAAATAGCLATPPAADQDATAAIDAAVGGGGDGSPCVGDACTQLLVVSLAGYYNEADTPPPGGGVGYQVLRRDPADGTWVPIAEAAGPSTNFNDGAWRDCCGAGGAPDGVPEAALAGYEGVFVARFTRSGADLTARAPYDLVGGNGDGGQEEAHVDWIDYDDDGDLDIVTANPDLRFYRNDGDTFVAQPPLAVGVVGVAVGNWDDDPEDELAIAGADGVHVRERGDGDWSVDVPILTGQSASTVRWCDVRGDGHPELAVMGGSSDVLLIANLGTAIDGNWLDGAAPIGVGDGGYADVELRCGDLDGDHQDDLIYAAYNGVYVVPHGSNSRQNLIVPTPLGVGLGLGDPDGDGRLDLFVATSEPHAVLLYGNASTGPGDFTLAAPVTAVDLVDAATSVAWIAIAP